MAENPADGVIWLLEIRREHLDWLGDIRHWNHLRLATEDGSLWVKGFNETEIESTPVKSIPVKKIWYQKEHLLFPYGSIVPLRKAPNLLWSPIERGLPLKLPQWNHNYFGFSGDINVSLGPTTEEKPAAALLVNLDNLQAFIETASAVRLRPIKWAILGAESALLLGIPILPIPGDAYWADQDFLMPSGYQFQHPELTGVIKDILSEANSPCLTLWKKDGTYLSVPKNSFTQLSIGSFRQSISLLRHSSTSNSNEGAF